MPDPTQKNRTLAIDTQLGPDKLLLRSFSIKEEMGRLFQMEVEMDCQDSDINFEDIVGTSATVRLGLPNGDTRYFNGIVSRFVQEQQGTVPCYRATLSPSLWLLTRTSDCQIFQNMSVKDIISQILDDNGITYEASNLERGTAEREYCVQYRETAFNFVSRLMEEEGIYYFFQHEQGKHTMVLADSPSAHDPYPGFDTLDYYSGGRGGDTAVTDWIIEKELQSGSYTVNDFDFTVPGVVTANDGITRSHENASLEVFDYPGGFKTSDEGEGYAKVRMEELQAQYEIVRAKTSAYGVATGYKFKLEGHPRSDQERDYIVIGLSLQATAGAYASGDAGNDFFSCSFIAMPVSTDPPVPFRLQRITPKPMIRGPQTAIVVASQGDEITTDEYGRVQVKFHWDRKENSSCYIRVSQNWAGKGWGSMQIPRKDQEVIVEFLEGDPDRPIITGRVYNGDQTVPYDLPANKTQSGIVSRSTTNGSTANFNSIWFEDKAGSEQFSIQAEKDMLINIENDSTETIGQNRTQTVKGTETKEVDGDKTDTFKGALSITVTKDVTETFNAGHTEQTTKTYSLQADTVAITGQTKISLTVGGSSITIDSNGITITSSSAVNMSANSQLEISSSGTGDISASGTLSISGSMTSINS